MKSEGCKESYKIKGNHKKIWNHKLIVWLVLLNLSMMILLSGCGTNTTKDQASTAGDTGPKVVASTSWTALIVKAAGVKEPVILAPLELQHPPEYDYRPSDVEKLNDAKYIVYGGYEPFMTKMLKATDTAQDKVVKVDTTNTPDILKQQAGILAEKFGTTAEEKAWEADFDKVITEIKDEANKKNVNKIKVLVNVRQTPAAKFFGYDVIGEFGPEELTPAKIAELANLKPDLIIDNFHVPLGKGLAEVTKVPRVELRNFPAPEHKNLQDLFLDNAKKLGIQVD